MQPSETPKAITMSSTYPQTINKMGDHGGYSSVRHNAPQTSEPPSKPMSNPENETMTTWTRSRASASWGLAVWYKNTTSDDGPLIGDQQAGGENVRFIRWLGVSVPRSWVRNVTNRRGFPGSRAWWVGWANPRRPGRCGWVPRRLTLPSNGYAVGDLVELSAGLSADCCG